MTRATTGTAHTQGRPDQRPGSGAGGASGTGPEGSEPDGSEPLNARLPLAASHIRRGSKALTANIVSTTTPAKLAIPGPGSIVVKVPNCTSATTIETMKTSMFDQRPMKSTKR